MADVRKLFRKAFGAALRSGFSKDEAEDAVQEAFLRVHQYERGNHIQSKEAVLMTATINILRDAKRRKQRAPFEANQMDLDEIFDRAPGPADVLLARTRLLRAADGLAQLNEKSRRILLARRLDDLSVIEIARREGMTISAVEKQIARATFKLMSWMDGW